MAKHRVLIFGADGYIGFALTQYLLAEGYEVVGVDSLYQRRMEAGIGEGSAVPIDSWPERGAHLRDRHGKALVDWTRGDITDANVARAMLSVHRPDTVVNLAQQPSAPYSLMDETKCIETHRNNCEGALRLLWALKEVCPEVPLVQIGSMGEYGTPDGRIVEPPIVLGVPVYDENRKTMNWEPCAFEHYPRKPSSFYHSAKVSTTHDTERACAWWGLRATDIMQGVVYGLDHPGKVLPNRFSVGESQGTALNRFCAQAVINHPLTVYGLGSQTRGFLPLRDSLQCLRLIIDNPPDGYRCLNQFDEPYAIVALATRVAEAAVVLGFEPEIAHLDNPRVEDEVHYYAPETRILKELGYVPAGNLDSEILNVLKTLCAHTRRIEGLRSCLSPKTQWK